MPLSDVRRVTQMNSFPKITLVTPSYNQGRFLEKTILSVLEQGYPNLEYIVIDGGSTDNSIEIVRRYENQLGHWVSEKDRGQAHAINKGFERASGDIFGWLNSDDYLEAGALHAVAEHALTFRKAGAFVGGGRIVNDEGRESYYKEPRELTFDGFCQWLDGGDFMQPSCFFRRSAWEAAGPLDESIHIALDVDLWLRMVKQVDFQRLDKLLSTSLSHQNAKTTAFRNYMVLECSMVIIKAGGDRFIRHRLNDIAARLSYYEENFKRISNHPIVKLLKPIGRVFVRPSVGWNDVSPKW